MRNCSTPLFHQFPDLRIGLFGKEFSGTTEDCAQALGFQRVSKLHQIHGNIIHIVKNDTIGFETQGDGLITNLANHALSVRFADCQGFVVYAPKKKVAAVLHAGWRGMAVKAITALYMKMQRDFGIDPHETFVGITPSICVKCYRFEDACKRLPEYMHRFIHEEYLDLQAAADAELDSLGVPREHRERHPACTQCGDGLAPSESEGFWSWRGDKRNDVRNYLVAGMVDEICQVRQVGQVYRI